MIQIQDDSVNQIVTPASTPSVQATLPPTQSSPALDTSSANKTSEIDQLLAELDKLSKNLEEKPEAEAKPEVVAESKPIAEMSTQDIKPQDENVSDEKFDFDSFLTDLEKKIDAESQKHQSIDPKDKDNESMEDFRKNRPAPDMQAEDSIAEEPKENFVFKKEETIDLNEKNDDENSEELKAQNVFEMLGLMNISDADKNQFLDELETMIWDDFIVHDLELLLTSEEYIGASQILKDNVNDDNAKKESLILYLEKLIPDLDEVLYEKALELKSEMMGERLSKMKEGASEELLLKIKEVEGLISQNLWKSASTLLNQLS